MYTGSLNNENGLLKPIAWRANKASSNKFNSAARRNHRLQMVVVQSKIAKIPDFSRGILKFWPLRGILKSSLKGKGFSPIPRMGQ